MDYKGIGRIALNKLALVSGIISAILLPPTLILLWWFAPYGLAFNPPGLNEIGVRYLTTNGLVMTLLALELVAVSLFSAQRLTAFLRALLKARAPRLCLALSLLVYAVCVLFAFFSAYEVYALYVIETTKLAI